jgi:hypothetical protein
VCKVSQGRQIEKELSSGQLHRCVEFAAKAFDTLERTPDFFSGIGIPRAKDSALNDILKVVRGFLQEFCIVSSVMLSDIENKKNYTFNIFGQFTSKNT